MSLSKKKEIAYKIIKSLNRDKNSLSVTLTGSYSEHFDSKRAGDIDIIIICKKTMTMEARHLLIAGTMGHTEKPRIKIFFRIKRERMYSRGHSRGGGNIFYTFMDK